MNPMSYVQAIIQFIMSGFGAALLVLMLIVAAAYLAATQRGTMIWYVLAAGGIMFSAAWAGTTFFHA